MFFLYHRITTFVQGLRDLVLNTNAQTQAAIASLNVSVQSMTNEVHRLKEQIKPILKRRKVSCGAEENKSLLWTVGVQ